MTDKKKEQGNIELFVFTRDQQDAVAKMFGEDVGQLQGYQICELLDRLIDEEAVRREIV